MTISSGSAIAGAITYTVDLPPTGDLTLKGTITTDGNLGTITRADILAWDLTVWSASLSSGYEFTPLTSTLRLDSDAGRSPNGAVATATTLTLPSPDYVFDLEAPRGGVLPYGQAVVDGAGSEYFRVCNAAGTCDAVQIGLYFPLQLADAGVPTPAPPNAYITNSVDGTVSVIDPTTNTVVMTIPVGRKPFGVAVTPDGNTVYIANSGDGTVSVIDTPTNTVIGSIAVGTDPVGVAVTPDGKTVYVTNQGDGTVSVINTATNTVIGSAIDVGCPIANCGRKTTNIPSGIAVTPDGSKVYVGNLGAPGYASVIATASNTVTTINTKKATTGVAVTPNGSKVYLGSLNGAVLAIDVATNSLGHGSTIGVGSGSEGVAVTPDGSKVYVADSAVGTVSVINTATNKVIGSINVGSDPQGVSVTSDGSKVYVANEGNGTVSIIDTATNTVETSTITVGKAPLAFGIFIPPPKPTK